MKEQTKKNLYNHFQYNWVKYLLVALAVIIGWTTIYSVVNNKKNWQKFDIACYFTPAITVSISDKLKASRSLAFGEDTVVEEMRFLEFGDKNNRYIFDNYVTTTDLTLITKQDFETVYLHQDYFMSYEEIIKAYPGDLKWQAMIDYLDSLGAAYRFNSEEYLAKYKFDSEESREREREKIAEYEGKIYGVNLGKLPRAEKGCFFEFEEISVDSDGKPVTPYRMEYILAINAASIGEKSSGGNKGVFNVGKEDKNNAQAFDFIKYFLGDDPTNPGLKNYDRFLVNA